LTGESVWAGSRFVKDFLGKYAPMDAVVFGPWMIPLSVGRFLDPILLGLWALGVFLYLAFRDAPPKAPAGRRSRWAVWTVWGGLWALSTPLLANQLALWTETRGPDLGVALAGKDPGQVAMVVLGSGIRSVDPSVPPREHLDGTGMGRTLAAARLWHERHFGLVVLSGAPRAEAEAMYDLILHEGVPADRVVVEDRSLNTRENAAYSTEILRERGMTTSVVVVTSATHLRRSLKDFAAQGIAAIPAAADIVGRRGDEIGVERFLPSAQALFRSYVCLHEILGYVRG
jgi:uncharacterized SAM-binding protein YcdF (DUF218 family)